MKIKSPLVGKRKTNAYIFRIIIHTCNFCFYRVEILLYNIASRSKKDDSSTMDFPDHYYFDGINVISL